MFSKHQIQNTKYEIRNTNEGFSLLELTISLFVITMLISVFLTNYNAGRRNADLTFSAQQLASDLRAAQNNALGSIKYGATQPLGGWGIHFDTAINNKNKYLIFADMDNDKLYDVGEAVTSSGGRTINFPTNVVLDSFTAGGATTLLDVTFFPPDPVTRIYWPPNSSSTSAIIRLKDSITGKTKNINVNILGLIEVE